LDQAVQLVLFFVQRESREKQEDIVLLEKVLAVLALCLEHVHPSTPMEDVVLMIVCVLIMVFMLSVGGSSWIGQIGVVFFDYIAGRRV
jgi:hypothetical protein